MGERLVAGKRKFIEDAAKVIDGRVAALKAEIEREETAGREISPGDRAAILEAEFCAKLIRKLADGPYREDPYVVAHARYIFRP